MQIYLKNTARTLIVLALVLIVSCSTKDNMKGYNNLSFEEKIALLDANIKKDPNNSELYYKRAKLYYEKENTKEALFNIQKAIALDKKNTDYYMLESDIFFARGESTLAFNALNNAIKQDSKNKEAYLKIAELSFYLRDYNRSRENIDKALKLDKTIPEAYFLRGIIYKEIGDTANAVKDYTKAIEYKSDYEEVFEELANIYADRDNALAIEYYKSTININPKNVNAMYNLGQFYQDHNSIQQALDMYQKVLKIKPDYANAIYAVGYVNYVYKKDYDMALDCFNKTIKADSTYFEAYSMRANIYEKKGRTAEAKRDHETADSLRNLYQQ